MEIKALTQTRTGTDNNTNETDDLIGNAGHLTHADNMDEVRDIIQQDDNNIVECGGDHYGTPDTIDWWDRYIRDNNAVDQLTSEVKDSIPDGEWYWDDLDALNRLLANACDDYELHAYNQLKVLHDYVGEHRLDVNLPESL